MYQTLSNTPSQAESSYLFIAGAPSAATTRTMYTFNPPKDAKLLWVTLTSGGGGGGGGGASAAATIAGGGGGGGASPVAHVLVPKLAIPSTLYIFLGHGGTGGTGQVQGGAAATAGITGTSSFLADSPITTDYLLRVGNASTAGTAASGSTAGAASSATTGDATGRWTMFTAGTANEYGGQLGGAGGTTSAAASLTIFASVASTRNAMTGGGTGGGGVNAGTTTTAGGTNLDGGHGLVPSLTQPNTGGNAGLYGYDHIYINKNRSVPFFSCGGNGGSGNTSAGTGGRGGDGGPGSGGGGGGGTNGAASVGGAGGNGGPGFCYITVVY